MIETGFYLFVYLFFINVMTFGLYALDKHKAVYNEWRIPEAVLLALAIFGGAYGAGMAMTLFRHKTKHTSFRVTVPLCFVIWIIFLLIIVI